MIKDNVAFLKEFIKEFQTTGTMFPSSKWAAQALTNPLRKSRTPQNILELGPGTGPVTVKILDDMQQGDHLVTCEINPRFMAVLKENLSSYPNFLKHKNNVEFFLGPIQELPETRKFDTIVCALPFLNFELKTVEEIFSKLERLSSPDTKMTYYEYIGLRSLGKVVSMPDRKKRLKEIDCFFKKIYKNRPVQRERVWLNLLPINIYTLDFNNSQAA